MRGTYYVYLGGRGVHIHVGRPVSTTMQRFGVVETEKQKREHAEWKEEASEGHVQIPLRVMKELAAKFWLEMSEKEKEAYLNDPKYEPYRLRAKKANESIYDSAFSQVE